MQNSSVADTASAEFLPAAVRPAAIVHCKAGVRSAEVLAVLKDAGFADAVHVGGGIVAWVNEIEPDKPTT